MKTPIKLRILTIIIRCVFSLDGKSYPQLFLDDALYDLVKKRYNTKGLIIYITSKFNFCEKNKKFIDSILSNNLHKQ